MQTIAKKINIYLLFFLFFSSGSSFLLAGCSAVPVVVDGGDVPTVDLNFKVYNGKGDLLGSLDDLVPIYVSGAPTGTDDLTFKIENSLSYIGLAIADKDTPTWAYVLTDQPYNPTHNTDTDQAGSIWSGLEMGRTTNGDEYHSDTDWVVLTKKASISPSYNLLLNEVEREFKVKCLLASSSETITLADDTTYPNITGFVNTAEYGITFLNYPQSWSRSSTETPITSSLHNTNNVPIDDLAYKVFGFRETSRVISDNADPDGKYANCMALATKFSLERDIDNVMIDDDTRFKTMKDNFIFPITIKNEPADNLTPVTEIATINLDTKYDDADNGFLALKNKLSAAGFIFPTNSLSQ